MDTSGPVLPENGIDVVKFSANSDDGIDNIDPQECKKIIREVANPKAKINASTATENVGEIIYKR